MSFSYGVEKINLHYFLQLKMQKFLQHKKVGKTNDLAYFLLFLQLKLYLFLQLLNNRL